MGVGSRSEVAGARNAVQGDQRSDVSFWVPCPKQGHQSQHSVDLGASA